ncbi:M3 family metallopeptidase [Lutibacter sp.]
MNKYFQSITLKFVLIFSVIVTIISCTKNKEKTQEAMQETNILLEEWTGPYGGVPAFDKMNSNNIKSALEVGMKENLADIDVITANSEKPTFENTIVALEKAGKTLNRVQRYYGIWSANISSPEFRKIQGEMAPKLSEFRSKISQNTKLFERIKTVYKNSLVTPLEDDQQRVVQLIYESFAMNGAELDATKKTRYAQINKELSTLYTNFSNNILADEENYTVFLNKNQLSGLSESMLKSMAKIASDKGQEGMYAIPNTRSYMSPFLTYSDERELRKQVWKNYYSRCDNGDEFDNNENIAKILKLRKERVGLLGYDNYADWRLQNRMAKNSENVMQLLNQVWKASTARVKEEVEDMQAIADANGDNITIEPWDYSYYAEKVRKQKYDLDSDEVKQYLQLDKLTEALFFVAGELFNYNFTPVPEGTVPVFQEDVKVWEVTDKTSGENIGLWYLDPFARPGKRSGAWATTYRSHSTFDGKKNVLASNNSNFVKPAPGEAVLVSWDDATTFLHEFGHALHFFSSEVRYPTLNGGVRDYTEFQSQVLERWLSTDKVINQFLVHYKTGKPMPKELITKIKKAATFNQGFATTEYLASAIMDMKLHMADPTNIDVDAFEKETLAKMNMPKELVMRHRTPHFGHVFSGEGYATAYYGYMWADVLTADAAEAFAEAPEGFYDKELATKMVKYLFAPRNAMDPAKAYRLFRGRDATIDALMRARGFSVAQ